MNGRSTIARTGRNASIKALKPQRAVVVALLCITHTALGQMGPAPQGSSTAGGPITDLQEVVVTASKRNEKERDLAGTVSVLQGADLERQGVQDQEQIFKQTPGVQFNKGDPDRALPTIRGIGTVPNANAIALQQATTGLYIEDVPFTDPFGFVGTADLAPFDLQRIEVLRGPQGALYGSASLGGAIRYITNKPNLESIDFSALSTLDSVGGNGPGYSLYAMANIPVVADVGAIRAVAFDRREPGYIRNIGTGANEANVLHQSGGRVIGTVKPTDVLTITGLVLTQKSEADDLFAVSPNPDQLQLNTPTPSSRSTQYTLGNLQVNLELGNQALTSNTGYFDKKADQHTDLTRRFGATGSIIDPSLPALPVVLGPQYTEGKSFSEELRVSSSHGAFNYVAGIFYQRTTYHLAAEWTAPGGEALWGALGPVLLTDDVFLHEVDSAKATEKAVFADLGCGFDNGISVSAGGREYRNELNYDIDSAFLQGPLVGTQNFAESGFTPKFTVKYKFGANLWYALASKGYRFGGVNVNPPNFSRYKSDSLWNYETGLKLEPLTSLSLDVTVFMLDWKNAQVNAITPGNIPLNGIANVGSAKVKGSEFAAKWLASRNFSLTATIAYTDATTSTDFLAASGVDVPSGSRLTGTPRFQSNVQGEFRFAGPAETQGRFDITHSYVGYRVFTIEQTVSAPSYSLVDARLSFARDHWDGWLYVDNIADKRGIAGAQLTKAIGAPAYTDYYLVQPRTYGVGLRYQFGP